MSSSKQETQSQSQTSPWAPQASALTSAFSNAQNAYGQASGAVAPTDFTAQMTPQQLAVFSQMLGTGTNLAGAVGGNAAAGSGMVTSGAGGAEGALTSLGAFNPSATNNTDNAIAAGKQYAAGMDIPGAVQSAMRDATQTARDVTLPGMESASAGNGNINSSRTGLAEGLVQRGLAEKAADISSDLYNNAYTSGADRYVNQAGTNNAQHLGALGSELSGGTSMATGGSSVAGAGVDQSNGALGMALTGASGQQANNQLGLTNQLQQYQSKVSSPYDALQGLMGIIGSNNWGSQSSGSSTTTSTPSAFQVIGGMMNSIGSLMSPFRMGGK
jgi:hypothetical protein